MTIFGTLTASFGFAMQIQSFIYIMKEDYVGKTRHVYLVSKTLAGEAVLSANRM